MAEYILDVRGMCCEDCERILQDELTSLPSVNDVVADADSGEVRVHGEPNTASRGRRAIIEARLRETIIDAGYEVGE
jgi:copper chaperone CopZ